MRVPVKAANGRRDPVPRSAPTYEVDLTREEMREIRWALEDRIKTAHEPNLGDSVSALAVVSWAMRGRR